MRTCRSACWYCARGASCTGLAADRGASSSDRLSMRGASCLHSGAPDSAAPQAVDQHVSQQRHLRLDREPSSQHGNQVTDW